MDQGSDSKEGLVMGKVLPLPLNLHESLIALAVISETTPIQTQKK